MRSAVNWRSLLSEEGVPFIERGPNVKRGEINIKCPFCGAADPSFHMGLNLENGWWACWRQRKAHSGKSPLRLLMVLLRVPYWKACEIAGLGEDFVDPDGFTAVAARILARLKGGGEVPAVANRFLAFPPEFAPLSRAASARRHRAYLEHRGFVFIDDLDEAYDLAHASSGEWRDRVIIPYQIGGRTVTWTARAIAPASLRYRDLSVDESLIPPKETLYNYDCIAQGGKVLVIVEGPIDALKIDFFGRGVGVRSVGLSTNSLSDEQKFMLQEAEGQFDRILTMMDNASAVSIVDSMRMRQELAFIRGVEIVKVPYGKKDAGELSARQALDWTTSIGETT
jgi:hypothetical protein